VTETSESLDAVPKALKSSEIKADKENEAKVLKETSSEEANKTVDAEAKKDEAAVKKESSAPAKEKEEEPAAAQNKQGEEGKPEPKSAEREAKTDSSENAASQPAEAKVAPAAAQGKSTEAGEQKVQKATEAPSSGAEVKPTTVEAPKAVPAASKDLKGNHTNATSSSSVNSTQEEGFFEGVGNAISKVIGEVEDVAEDVPFVPSNLVEVGKEHM